MDLDPDACYRAIATRDIRFDGRIFMGVRSTGVYCRPVCPARTPLKRNVTFFPTAAAAQEAGFRPCLRCRPETSPDLGAWRGTSNTVRRALRLIEDGALDTAGVEDLAGRLGVGGRQLSRLFRAHLGASPAAVAQTRRVLLAKQLLQETRLPMAQVALAAGFGSVRRFNETFQHLYGRPPGALRRTTTVETPPDAVQVTLPYQPPYDWDGLLAFLAAHATPGVEAVEGDRYARAIDLAGAQGVVTASPGGGNRLSIAIRFPTLSELPTIIARLRRVFDLAADPVAIADHLARDARLARLVAARRGLRVPGAWDGFELAVRTILGQQITVTAATTLAGRLAAAYGEPLTDPRHVDLGLSHVFPAPARLAGADIAGMPRLRAASLSSLAKAVLADPRLFDPGRDLDAAVAQLRALPGVGEWTAQYIAMRQLREPDAFPAADLALMRAMAAPDGTRPTPAQLLKLAEPWRPWRAYAALHLWAAEASTFNEKTPNDSIAAA